MSIRKAAGFALMSVPFVAITGLSLSMIGLFGTLTVWGAVGASVSIFVVGAWLLDDA